MAYYNINRRSGKFCCQVRWHPDGSKKRKSKNKTFKSKSAAKAWGELKVKEIETSISIGNDIYSLDNPIKTLGELIQTYLDDEHVTIGRSKRMALRAITHCDIASTEVKRLKPKHFVDYAKERKVAGASPSTVAGDISHVRAALKAARALYDVDADENPIVQAMPTLHTLKLIGKSNIRSRRPTGSETTQLTKALKEKEKHKGTMIPYADIFEFSILSCMRIGEVCRILWEDLDIEGEWVMVRDRKDPRKKEGNHMRVPLLGGAMDIILKQSKTDPRIFPYNSRSVTTGFRNTRKKLGIEDLRYHDLRREGASRLLEQGYSIERVAQVTGHRDLNTLWRIYTDLNPNKDKR